MAGRQRVDLGEGRYPPLIEIVVERGPYGLVEPARASCGYGPLADGYAGKCHLCVDLRRRLVETRDCAQLRPPGFYANF